jgi:FMN-binding protein
MTAPGLVSSSDRAQSAVRRTRARRVVAFAGMLATVAGLVGVRAALTPPPTQALGSSGLATEAGTNGTGRSSSAPHPAPSGGPPRGNRVVVGKAYDVSYGLVQVKVTFAGSRIADITPISLPRGGRSGDISQYAAPLLRREALRAQSAHIDTVSGASYTSAGYAMSLQSALDQSGR